MAEDSTRYPNPQTVNATVSDTATPTTQDPHKQPIIDASQAKAVVNVQTPVANLNISTEAVQVATTAASTAAGLKAGLELAKNLPGIGAKAAVIAGTVIAAHTANITVNKIITSSSSSSYSPISDSTKWQSLNTSFISSFSDQAFPSCGAIAPWGSSYCSFTSCVAGEGPSKINENINNIKNNGYFSEYPYNLIPDLNMYINIEIWFLIILINVLFTSYLFEKKIDINKFIKNDRFRKLLNFMYNRYISVWSVSRNIIIVWCILMLIFCIFMSKFILFLVFSI